MLADDRTIFLVAFDDSDPIGLVLAYDLLRRRGDAEELFVDELEVEDRRDGALSNRGRPQAQRGDDVGVRLQGTLTALRPATEYDVDLLVGWHADPEVSRFWDNETFTFEQLCARLGRPDVDAYIVESSGEPIGYLEAWRGEDRTGGLDMFLVPEARGRGYGPDAARALATDLRDRVGWKRITTDPYVWNEGAVRAWGRAGFQPVEERPADDEHTAPWLLMVFVGTPAAPAGP